MTRLVKRPITVDGWKNNLPVAFWDGTVFHRIEAYMDLWSEAGNWWDGEESRQMLRVYTSLNQMFDLEGCQGSWFIYKVWD